MSGQVNVNLDRLIRLLEANPDSIDQIRDSSLPLAGSDSQLSPTRTGRLESNGSQRSEPNEDEFRLSEFAGVQTSPITGAVFSRNSPGYEIGVGIQDNSRSIERSQSPVGPTQLEMSFANTTHLIDLFFSKIQPWLPLLHKPSFYQRYADRSHRGTFDLQALPVDEALLLSSLFALSARYSSSGAFPAVPQAELSDHFAAMARDFYGKVRALTQPTLACLQGYIMLAFYFYTSGLSTQGWILIGVCVRYAYELDLCDLDDDDCPSTSGLDWIRMEEMRRAWWLVWELDTFGSILCKRPYAVDRRRMTVMLPMSDEAWFSGNSTSSSKLITRPGQSWKSLQGSDNNCNERAWFLIANFLMSLAHEALSQKDGISARDKLILENDISCFKLSLPPCFRISTEPLAFDAISFAQSNWIIATNLMLASTSFMMSNLRIRDEDGHNHVQEPKDASMASRRWAFEFSRIVSLWSADYIALSHPFLVCSTIPIYVPSVQGEASDQQVLSSSKDLAGLVQSRFAEKWRLGSLARRE
jgi:Fungal specific transcription factor domain